MHTPRIQAPFLAVMALLMLAAFAAAGLMTLGAQMPSAGVVRDGPPAASPAAPTDGDAPGIDSLAFGA